MCTQSRRPYIHYTTPHHTHTHYTNTHKTQILHSTLQRTHTHRHMHTQTYTLHKYTHRHKYHTAHYKGHTHTHTHTHKPDMSIFGHGQCKLLAVSSGEQLECLSHRLLWIPTLHDQLYLNSMSKVRKSITSSHHHASKHYQPTGISMTTYNTMT